MCLSDPAGLILVADLPAGTGRDRIIGYVYLDPAFFTKYGSYVLAAFAGKSD